MVSNDGDCGYVDAGDEDNNNEADGQNHIFTV